VNEFAPIIAGAFALSGVVLGAVLGRTGDHRKWLRDERMKAYQQYLELFGVAQIRNFLEITGPSGVEPNNPLSHIEQLHNAGMRVLLVAPPKIADEVSRSLDLLFEVQGWANDLPGVLAEKHYKAGMTVRERAEADESLRAEALEQLGQRLDDFLIQSVGRLENVTNLIRSELKAG
jgi:hypothetical protein